MPFSPADLNLPGHCSFVSVAFFLRGFDRASLFPSASKSVAVTDPPLRISAVRVTGWPVLNIGLVAITAGASGEIGSSPAKPSGRRVATQKYPFRQPKC